MNRHKAVAVLMVLLGFLLAIPHGSAQRFSAWLPPVNIGPPVNTALPDAPGTLTKDGLRFYFVVVEGQVFTSTTPQDIWVATRESEDEAWGTPQRLQINKSGWINPAGRLVQVQEGNPFVTTNGHTMYFSRTTRLPDANGVVPPGGLDIFISYRHNKRHDFGPLGWQEPTLLPGPVNTAALEGDPIVFEDELTGVMTLYFISNRLGTTDIFASTLQPDGTFGEPQPVTELNSSYAESSPTISRDGLEIYFISNRPGSAIHPPTDFGPGGFPAEDIWVSRRASTVDPWGEPENLDWVNAAAGGPRINSDYHDGRPVLSFDGEVLHFFSAFREGNQTIYFDIWKTTREKLTGDGNE